jgi:hypothetical protein
MKVILGDLSARTGNEKIFQKTTGREILHEASSSNKLRATDFAIINSVTEYQITGVCVFGGTYIMLRK